MVASTRLVAAALLVGASVALVAGQGQSRDTTSTPAAPGSALLSGRVVNDVTNRPVRRAVVSITGADTRLRLTSITDDNGAFAFLGLQPDRYTLGATRPGYVTTGYGARKVGRPGTPISIAAGEQRTDLALRMPPGAVVTGVVRNGSGEPLPGVRVMLLRQSFGYDTGERTLASAGPGIGLPTDDRGEYRIFGLAADEYYVVATMGLGIRSTNELRETSRAEIDWATRLLQLLGPASPGATAQAPAAGRTVDYAPVFFPNVYSQSGASIVAVKEGEERRGVDITIDPIPTAKVFGTVIAPDGVLPPNLLVSVIAHDTVPGVPFSGFGNARVDANGKFVSPGLSPGDYTITVRVGGGRGGGPATPATQTLFGLTTVSVSGSDLETTVTLRPGVTVSGRVVFEATTLKAPTDLSTVGVSLTPVRGRTPTLGVGAATVDASGAFTFTGVTPGRYRLSSSLTGWQLKSGTIQGVETLDTPIELGSTDVSGAEVTLTDRTTEVSGRLLDAAGKPAPEYFIIVFSADRKSWIPQSRRIQSVRPGSDGRFTAKNLPPGDYLIAAVTDVEQGEWYDPQFLTQLLPGSTKVTLGEGGKVTQDLQIR